MLNAIVLDGDARSALAVTRSLGRRGVAVAVGSHNGRSLASSSSFCNRSFVYPSPYTNPTGFLKAIAAQIESSGKYVLIPMTDVSLAVVLKNKALFCDQVELPFVGYDQYAAASDKANLFKSAIRLGVPIPRTVFSDELRETGSILDASSRLGYPVVIKPARSRILLKNGWSNTYVRYANNAQELEDIISEEHFQRLPYVVQEKIEGPGIGIFLLFASGRIVARFSHKRIREKPPSGGVSVLCESIEAPPVALDAAEKLLRHLNWFGVAMVEFKWDERDNTPKLMEINARFWGSLQLAISSGIDFPFLLYSLVSGDKISSLKNYKIGLKSRWELGDFDHLFIRLMKRKERLNLPKDAPSRMQVLASFMLDFLRPSVRNEVLRFDDPGPFIFELKQYLREMIS